jgi:LuxR family maltose regulon positive regulatory protein
VPTPLLKTKLYIPPPHPNLISRPRLLEQLDQGTRGKLIVISAPPGFGKTTLLGDWLRERAWPTAWLSLDPADNDPHRFITYLAAAYARLNPSIGRTAQALLELGQRSSFETILTGLIDDLAENHNVIAPEGQPVLLVLDDYQVVTTHQIHDAVSFLLQYLPPGFILIIATRHDPDLALARLRIEGSLAEVRASDLRFEVSEIKALFKKMNQVELSPDQLRALESRTEGWAAGLQVASLGLSERPETLDFIVQFTGSDRYLLDYLVDEVLQQQPEHIRRFLLTTSILTRFCAPLGDRLMAVEWPALPGTRGAHSKGGRNSAAIIDDLLRGNLFVVPLDEKHEWYRYHLLFAGTLQAQLQKSSPEVIPKLHRLAAEWLAENEEVEEAISHAILADEFSNAAHLVETIAKPIILRGEYRMLEGWLEALPEDLVRGSPQLCLAWAWVYYYVGPLEKSKAWIQAAEELITVSDCLASGSSAENNHQLTGEIAAMRALAASSVGDTATTIQQGQSALDHLSGADIFLRITVLLAVGLAHRYNGEIPAAVASFEQAFEASQPAGHVHQTLDSLCNIANLQLLAGELKQGEATLEKAFKISTVPIDKLTALASEAYILKAVLNYEHNNLEAAGEHVGRSLDLAEKGGLRELQYAGFLWRSFINQARGDFSAAQADMAATEKISSQLGLERIDRHVRAAKARLALAMGDLKAAQDWVQRIAKRRTTIRDHLLPIQEFELVSRVQVKLASNEYQRALDLLEPAVAEADQAGRLAHVFQMNLYQAVASLHAGDAGAAMDILIELLPILEVEGYQRLVLDVGPLGRDLLTLAVENKIEAQYAQSLLNAPYWPTAAGSRENKSDYPIRLTDRETEVLALVGAGFTNQEIADNLHITPGTVKRHLFNIFRKLDVKNRTQAVTSARGLGLLP